MSTNATLTSDLKNSSSSFFCMGKIFTAIGKYFPPLKLHFFIHNISENRHMKYNGLYLSIDQELVSQNVTSDHDLHCVQAGLLEDH